MYTELIYEFWIFEENKLIFGTVSFSFISKCKHIFENKNTNFEY